MDFQLFIIVALTFIIHLIGTLAYAFRIAGIRTGQIAIAFSLFNILVLVSRTSNAFQSPFLAKRVETAIQNPLGYNLTFDFMAVLAAASFATLVGGLLIPTFQRCSVYAVASFWRHRSVPRLLFRGLTPGGIAVLVGSAAVPSFQNLRSLRVPTDVPVRVILMNFVASALWTVGVLAAIYAGFVNPQFRLTSSTLSAVINGLATIMMFVLVDPYLAGLTDDAVSGRVSDDFFRKAIIWMVASRLAGTLFAQVLLLPSADVIVLISRLI
jgi:hypothetical protein